MSLASRSITVARPLLLVIAVVLIATLLVVALVATHAGLPWTHTFLASHGHPFDPCPGSAGGSC